MVDGDIGEGVPVIFLYLYSLLIQFLIKLMVVISSNLDHQRQPCLASELVVGW